MRPWLPAAALLVGGVAALTVGVVDHGLDLVLVGVALVALANGYLLVRSDAPPDALAATIAAAFGVVPAFVAPGVGHLLSGAVALTSGAVVVRSFVTAPSTA